MNRLNALYFPDTVPDPGLCRQLLLFFDKISQYQASELSAAGDTEQSPPGDFLTASGLYSWYPPAPLGDDLNRFKRLVHELQDRQNDYGSRLTGLSLIAPTFDQATGMEASTTALAAALSGGQQPDDRCSVTEARRRENLWQARLLLTLAEILDRQNLEIARELQKIRDRERKLFLNLKGIDQGSTNPAAEIPLPASTIPTETNPEDKRLLKERTKAWAQLFVAEQDGEQRPAYHLLVTGRPAAASFLFDRYETLYRRPPVPLFTITLPMVTATGEEYLARRNALRASTGTTFMSICESLRKITVAPPPGTADRGDPEPPGDLARLATAWQSVLQKNFKETQENLAETGRLTLYLFENTSLASLCRQAFSLTEPNRQQTSGPPAANSLLAVIDRNESPGRQGKPYPESDR